MFVFFSQIAIMWLKARAVFAGSVKDSNPIRSYMELLIWEKMTNACIKGRMMGVMIVVIPIIQIVTSSGLILGHTEMLSIQKYFFFCLTLDCISPICGGIWASGEPKVASTAEKYKEWQGCDKKKAASSFSTN